MFSFFSKPKTSWGFRRRVVECGGSGCTCDHLPLPPCGHLCVPVLLFDRPSWLLLERSFRHDADKSISTTAEKRDDARNRVFASATGPSSDPTPSLISARPHTRFFAGQNDPFFGDVFVTHPSIGVFSFEFLEAPSPCSRQSFHLMLMSIFRRSRLLCRAGRLSDARGDHFKRSFDDGRCLGSARGSR
jgi:hypothetical protein